MAHRHTPTLKVCDARGVAVRTVGYLVSQAVVERVGVDGLGRTTSAWDARMMDSGLPANLHQRHDLGGRVLRRQSVDSGWRVELFDGAGQVAQRWDGRGHCWRFEQDACGRLARVHQQAGAAPSRCLEQLEYGAALAEPARNLRGRVVRHFDPAGLLQWPAFSVRGEASSEARWFLQGLEAPDWPLSEADLEADPHRTRRYFYPDGQQGAQVDAAGHRTEWRHAVDGQLREVRLALAAGAAQTVVSDLQYDAAGHQVASTAGNGIRTVIDFEPADGRRWRQRTLRGDGECLQALVLGHDPVGNPVRVEDLVQPLRFRRNQRIEPVCHFAYDSLGRLIEATGWESDQARGGPGLPPLEAIGDSNRQRNYTRRYDYDLAGNLLELRHLAGDDGYRRKMKVAAQSNHALFWAHGNDEPDLVAGFDACGNQQQLEHGCGLQWSARNELARATTLLRADAANDEELYQYDAAGMRVRKVRFSTARARQHQAEVRYLPGIELRNDTASGERLQVISLALGEGSLNVVHWQGEPPGGLANDQHRYACNDALRSSLLEFDADGGLITHEHYHPFGTTAWWAGRGALEASYTLRRYCGRERDATGLYYYGARYFATWLHRWVSADPLGEVDGLNLYRAMRNSPLRFIDQDGCQTAELDALVPTMVTLAALLVLAMFLLFGRRPANADRGRPTADEMTHEDVWAALPQASRDQAERTLAHALGRDDPDGEAPSAQQRLEMKMFIARESVANRFSRNMKTSDVVIVPMGKGERFIAVGTRTQGAELRQRLSDHTKSRLEALKASGMEAQRFVGSRRPQAAAAPTLTASSSRFETASQSRVSGKKAENLVSETTVTVRPASTRPSTLEVTEGPEYQGSLVSMGLDQGQLRRLERYREDLKAGRVKHSSHLVHGQMTHDLPGQGQTRRGALRLLYNQVPGGYRFNKVVNYH